TKIAQKLPEDLENQLLNFQRFVIRLRQQNKYPLGMIANINETPVYFDMAGSLIMNPKDAKTVHIRMTGNDKNRKLPPVIIFKGKVWPSSTAQPLAGITVWFQEKGWMDEEGIDKWIAYWNNNVQLARNSKAMLVLDSFSAHITDQAKALFRSENTDLAVIPGGLTMYRWVLNAWEDISEDITIRSFKKCGISNCLSRSEDHLIYELDKDSKEEDSDENDENSDENDEDSDENEDENSDETGDEDFDKNKYENSDENEGKYSGKDDEESNKNNNEFDDSDKSNNKINEYS
ncbi:10234_t:CDS:2, partial [Gigaspora margarita]